MRSRNRLGFAGAFLLAGCAAQHHPRPESGRVPSKPAEPRPRQPLSDLPVKVGAPYQVRGIWYVPADTRGYDEVGYASWYGPTFHGGATANGERYDQEGVSAAHKTLPLPCYVEVTALDTGRTILVRVNDRGPFVSTRIIDLSLGAARQLGIDRQGVARVRVRRVDPPAADSLALRLGRAAPMRPGASPTTLANLSARLSAQLASAATVQPPVASHRLFSVEAAIASAADEGAVPRAGVIFVQVAALADRARADALAASLAGLGSPQVLAGPPFRVRIGPYLDEPSASAALAQLSTRGYGEARLVRDAPALAARLSTAPSTDRTP